MPPKDELASQIGVLYKYVKIDSDEMLERAISMIVNKTLWFWHVTGQNDPKECNLKVYFGGDFRARYNYFKQDFRAAYPNQPSMYLKVLARKAARKPKIPKAHLVYDYWAICCFTKKNNSPDLWHEYTKDGEGIIIEYEAKNETSIGRAGKVKYSDDKVKLDILKMNEEVCYRIITTKTKGWEHEEEYRMVERLNLPKSGKNFIFKDINILSIRLGSRLKENYATHLEKVCTENTILVLKSYKNAQQNTVADHKGGADFGD